MKYAWVAFVAALGGTGFYIKNIGQRILDQITFDCDRGVIRARAKTPEIDRVIGQYTDVPFQIEHTAYFKAAPQEVFSYISDFEKIREWMPGLTRTWTDNAAAETPGGAGAVRCIRALGGKMTYETVRYMDAPDFFLYSASDESLGGMYTEHLGAQICLPEGEGTRFIWRSYARPSSNIVMKWVAKITFLYFVGQSIINLEKRFN